MKKEEVKMKAAIGMALIVMGIAFGLYVGLYVCFYGGIVQVIDGIKADFSAPDIALGILRFLCTGIAGVFSALALIVPGKAMLD